MGFNDALSYERSYYVASANRFDPAPSLTEAITADICVVGGGCSGISAALHARERGYSVVLLEGGKIGWGASGRNGGQMIPGLRKSALELVKLYGKEKARELFTLSNEAQDLAIGLINKHGIQCDLRQTGHLEAALKPRFLHEFEEEAECQATVMNYPHLALLDQAETRALVDSPLFVGGLLDRGGAHYHPLNYTLGLADAARAAGVQIFEQSPATAIEQGEPATVRTARGSVRATYIVLACDAFLGDLDPVLAGKIMPVANYIVATEPLDRFQPPIPSNVATSDTKFVVDYFRMSADNRLVFGGGERYTPNPPQDIAAFVRPYLEETFPQIKGVRIDYGWGGMVSVTLSRLPDLGRRGNVFHLHGYSGKGAILSTLAGKLVAEAVAGTAERFDLMASIAPPAFPGGTRFRYPLYVLGMLWYALRDRL